MPILLNKIILIHNYLNKLVILFKTVVELKLEYFIRPFWRWVKNIHLDYRLLIVGRKYPFIEDFQSKIYIF